MYLPNVKHGQGVKRTKAVPVPDNRFKIAKPAIMLGLALLTGCTPSPQEAAMPDPQNTPQKPAATQGPVDTPAEAQGRQALSTAFVRLGPDGHLTVELRDGRVMVLKNVRVGAKDYCGVPVSDVPASQKFCGSYADVVAARPGLAPAQPAFVDPNTIEPAPGTPKTP
jgi:hypothetical protein